MYIYTGRTYPFPNYSKSLAMVEYSRAEDATIEQLIKKCRNLRGQPSWQRITDEMNVLGPYLGNRHKTYTASMLRNRHQRRRIAESKKRMGGAIKKCSRCGEPFVGHVYNCLEKRWPVEGVHDHKAKLALADGEEENVDPTTSSFHSVTIKGSPGLYTLRDPDYDETFMMFARLLEPYHTVDPRCESVNLDLECGDLD